MSKLIALAASALLAAASLGSLAASGGAAAADAKTRSACAADICAFMIF